MAESRTFDPVTGVRFPHGVNFYIWYKAKWKIAKDSEIIKVNYEYKKKTIELNNFPYGDKNNNQILKNEYSRIKYYISYVNGIIREDIIKKK